MATFETLFPSLIQACAQLHALLRAVAFSLFIVGTILFVMRGFTHRMLLMHLVRLMVLTACLVMLPRWGNAVQSLLQETTLSGLGVDPQHVQDQFNHLIDMKRAQGPDRSWWDLLSDLNAFSAELLISAALWLLGHFASLLFFWAYIIQKVILFLGYALSPLLIGLMAIPALRPVGGRYLLNLVGVLLWPLGWATAALITQGMLDFMTDPSIRFYDPTGGLFTLQQTFGLGVLAFWIVFSTIAAPAIIQRVFTYGALAGGPLLSGAVSSFLQTAATSAGAAAVGASTGLPTATLGSALVAGALSTLSTASGHGSAGAILIAGSGLPPRTARGRPGDDISGDQLVRDLIARSRSPRL